MNQFKKYAVAAALISVCSTAVFCASPASAASAGWYEKDGKKHYAAVDGSDVTGETVIEGIRYLFAPNGALQTGWQTIDGKRWYFDAEGNAVFGWLEWRGERYYIDRTQGKVTSPGVVMIPEAGSGAYFDECGVISQEWYQIPAEIQASFVIESGAVENGAAEYAPVTSEENVSGRANGVFLDETGIPRYYGADGTRQDGWVELEGGYLYASPDCGVLTGEQYLDGVPYLFGEDGIALSGFQTLSDGKTRWLTGSPVEIGSGWKQDPQTKAVYYFDTNGVMAVGRNIQIDGAFYSFSDKEENAAADGLPQYGRLIVGFDTADGNTYYYDEDSAVGAGYGAMTMGWKEINGKQYHFSWDGTMSVGITSVDGLWYAFAEDGTQMTGWIEANGSTYCFAAGNGAALTGVQEIEGKTYRFDDFGVLQPEAASVGADAVETPVQSGWTTENGNTYYIGSDNEAVTYWQLIDGKDYYFGEDGVLVTGDIVMDNITYHFGEDGAYLGADFKFTAEQDALLKGAERAAEPIRSLDIWDGGTDYCMTRTEFPTEKLDIKPGFVLKDEDIEIIERFAAEHFASSMSITEKMWVTLQWIHMNTNYAFDYTAEVYRPSFVDTIFNNRLGQCIQYNGAMASVLAYYGFDAYVVKGCTKSGSQHFWCEVKIGEQRYYVETGNFGKNGNWQYFFLPVNG